MISLFAAMHIIVKKTGNINTTALEVVLGPPNEEDERLLSFGPYYEAEEYIDELTKLGFEYFVDFFEIPFSGGPIPDWCRISLTYNDTENNE